MWELEDLLISWSNVSEIFIEDFGTKDQGNIRLQHLWVNGDWQLQHGNMPAYSSCFVHGILAKHHITQLFKQHSGHLESLGQHVFRKQQLNGEHCCQTIWGLIPFVIISLRSPLQKSGFVFPSSNEKSE